MRNLHRALAAQGVESRILGCIGESSPAENVEVIPEWRASNLEAIEESCIHANRTSRSNTHFSLDVRGARVTEHPAVRDADVLHLHWTAGFLSTRSLHELADLGKPVCWTLHDLRPVSGGCHFPAGCENYRDVCDPCPQLDRDPLAFARNGQAAQGRAVARLRPRFVAPSCWLAEAARASRVAGGLEVDRIPYGVDVERFAPGDRAAARRRLGMRAEARYVMLGAHSFAELRKGIAQADEILRQLADDRRVTSGEWRLVCAGAKPPDELGGWPVDALGHLSHDDMAALYVAADVLLFTSLEDNMPNILLEAIAAALPIVALAAGGTPDVVKDGVNGALLPTTELPSAARAIRELLESPELAGRYGVEGRRLAEKEFSLELQAVAYAGLYRNLLETPRGEVAPATDRSEAAAGAPELAAVWDLARSRAEEKALRGGLENALQQVDTLRKRVAQQKEAIENLRLRARQRKDAVEELRRRIEFLESRIEDIGRTKWFRLGAKLRVIGRGITQV